MSTTPKYMSHAMAGLALALTLAACASPAAPNAESPTPVASPEPSGLAFRSPDLGDDGYLPEWAVNAVAGYCDGTDNRSPVLEWSRVPEGTVELALTLTDPQAPDYVHWVVTELDPALAGLAAADDGAITAGVVGVNWQGSGIYAGPCIPNRTYLFSLYALDTDIEADETTNLDQLHLLIDGHVIDEASFEVKVR